MSENNNLAAREYDLSELGEDDVRLVDSKKEAIFINITILIVSVAAVLTGYLLSPTIEELQAGTELATLFGYPLWVMVPVIIYVCEVIFFLIYSVKIIKTPSLGAHVDDSDE